MADVVERSDEWHRIKQELSDPKWDFHTVDGLAKATGMPADRVKELLDEHAHDIRIAYVRDRDGRLLYTTADRPMRFQEMLATAHAFAANTVFARG
jgi:hypothetical protein